LFLTDVKFEIGPEDLDESDNDDGSDARELLRGGGAWCSGDQDADDEPDSDSSADG